jgi:hypothetical protein
MFFEILIGQKRRGVNTTLNLADPLFMNLQPETKALPCIAGAFPIFFPIHLTTSLGFCVWCSLEDILVA